MSHDEKREEALAAIAAAAAEAGPAAQALRKQVQDEAATLRSFSTIVESMKAPPGASDAAMRNAGIDLAVGLAREIAEVVEGHIVPLAVVADGVNRPETTT